MESTLNKKDVITELTKSPHGDLQSYVPTAKRSAVEDPDFFAHLLAWNHRKGVVKDSRIALPVIALAVHPFNDESLRPAAENALALLADLEPRSLLKALEFAKEIGGPSRMLRRRLTLRYLRELESDYRNWERVALRHREVMRTLYGRYHIAPGGGSKNGPAGHDIVLMKGAAVQGKFAMVRQLAALPAADIAVAIKRYQIPFLVARGALGARAKETDVCMALMNAMTDVELVTNMRGLTRLGVKNVPELRATLEARLAKAGTSKKRNRALLKTTQAAKAVEAAGDEQLGGKLRELQERQLDTARALGGVDGDWLVLGDASSSMQAAIEVARQVASILARMVKGKVHLVFFNETPRYFDATGMSYEALQKLTALVRAGGNTSIGCGLDYVALKGIQVDGIAVISDGGHNRMPSFSSAYSVYRRKNDGAEPTVYFYQTPGDRDVLTAECRGANINLETFDLRRGGTHGHIDFYSLPTVVETMRVSRYSLVDEIMDTPLATLDAVMPNTKSWEVLRRAQEQTAHA